ncbi:MAG: glutaminyl-peptide cyclotransferase [Crocinitomicaceae bacterium]|nr:glutaminyl-peptide cyclotransferase [Crocinitomicaceae bacterium]
MKKYHLLIVSLLIVLVSCKDESTELAQFTFQDNLAVKYKEEVTIEIQPIVSDLKEIRLEIGNEVVKTWNSFGSENLKFTIDSKALGIGAKDLLLVAKDKSGNSFEDKRIIRVVSDIQPKLIDFEIVGTLPHNISNFTQGLEFSGDQLYEGTGQQGESKLAKIDLRTGNDILKVGLDGNHFGEGITIVGDTVYQLTWTSGKCFLYNKNTLEILPKEHLYKGEGWGICNDGKYLIVSDGSERLTYRNKHDFSIVKTIEVYTHEQPVIRLNELEYINGYIFANIWMTSNVAIIEPETGRVVGVLNCANLVSQGRGSAGDVLNGIAYNKNEDLIYLTGKYWTKTFKIKLKQNLADFLVSN